MVPVASSILALASCRRGSPYWCLVVEAAAENEKEGAGGVGVGGLVVGLVIAAVICITTSS